MLRFCVGDSLSLLRKSLCLKDTVTGCSVRFGDREVSEREGNFSEAILFVIRTENFISGEFVRAYVRCCNFSFLRFAEENWMKFKENVERTMIESVYYSRRI